MGSCETQSRRALLLATLTPHSRASITQRFGQVLPVAGDRRAHRHPTHARRRGIAAGALRGRWWTHTTGQYRLLANCHRYNATPGADAQLKALWRSSNEAFLSAVGTPRREALDIEKLPQLPSCLRISGAPDQADTIPGIDLTQPPTRINF